MGPERTDALARAQYRSLRRLAVLPDDDAVFPTHGAGSFCSAPPGADRTSTIGREKATNPLLPLRRRGRVRAGRCWPASAPTRRTSRGWPRSTGGARPTPARQAWPR